MTKSFLEALTDKGGNAVKHRFLRGVIIPRCQAPIITTYSHSKHDVS